MIDTISIALPVCIKAVPAKTNTKSGYAIAAANEEFFVRFRYWFVEAELLFLKLGALLPVWGLDFV